MTMTTAPIEHVIVLMFENRSFDHMLGFLPAPWGDLTGNEYNLVDPSNPQSQQVFVTPDAGDLLALDPDHSFLAVQIQMGAAAGGPPPMNGFVASYVSDAGGNVGVGMQIMQCHSLSSVPTLASLAQEFCLCTNWFSSVPGPTWPNRFYVHAATSAGQVENNPIVARTIYDNLKAASTSWNVYFGDVPQCLGILNMAEHLGSFRPLETFFTDVQQGQLPAVSFLEPRYFDFLGWEANDQHPPHYVSMGEALLAEVYETLRNSSLWDTSLLVVLYDEHGGTYDQIPPPSGVPNPDGKVSTTPPFGFTSLGVRTPAVLVSPLIAAGTVDATVYDHSSSPATIKKLFGLPSFLTARDAAANTFDCNLTLEAARTDAPETLSVPGDAVRVAQARRRIRTGVSEEAVASDMAAGAVSTRPPSDFQMSLIRPRPAGRAATPGAGAGGRSRHRDGARRHRLRPGTYGKHPRSLEGARSSKAVETPTSQMTSLRMPRARRDVSGGAEPFHSGNALLGAHRRWRAWPWSEAPGLTRRRRPPTLYAV